MPVAVPSTRGLTKPCRKISDIHRPGSDSTRPPTSRSQKRTIVSKQAYATPLTTPNVSPSIRSSNSGRLASSTGPICRIASPTIGTTRATSRKVHTLGPPPRSVPSNDVVGSTGRCNHITRRVKRIVSTPVRPKASPVTGIGSSSQRFTSYR